MLIFNQYSSLNIWYSYGNVITANGNNLLRSSSQTGASASGFICWKPSTSGKSTNSEYFKIIENFLKSYLFILSNFHSFLSKFNYNN